MAGSIPSFITGANAKIKLDNLTIAFAQDVSYAISVNTIPIRAMGKLEVAAYEPVSYTVQGTMTVVRYTKDAATAEVPINYKLEEQKDASGAVLKDADGKPIMVGVYKANKKTIPNAATNGNSVNRWQSSSGNIGNQVNPGKIMDSLTFDLEIFSKIKIGSTEDTESVIKIRDCRIINKSGSLTKKGMLMDQFTFNAILVNNDEEFASSKTGYTDFDVD